MMKTETNPNAARDTGHTLTQSENLKVGARGDYKSGPEFTARCEAIGVSLWVEKRPAKPDAFTRNLRTFVSLPGDYKLVYGISFQGADYDCGDMPRDLGKVLRGIEIALGK
jgi:hypothetical protein